MVKIDTDIVNGSPKQNRELISSAFKRFEGQRVTITIQKVKRSRSSAQNRYIHAMFTDLTFGLNQLGNEFTTSEVKEMCKAKFALIDMVDSDGQVIGQRPKGTSEMETWEMNEFVEKVIYWADDMFGIRLALPNEAILLDFNP